VVADCVLLQLDLEFDKLIPWIELEALNGKAGKGRYRMSFRSGVTRSDRVILELGEIEDAYKVSLNGRVVRGFDRLIHAGDITDHLVEGENSKWFESRMIQ
jgi:hypothetical protein